VTKRNLWQNGYNEGGKRDIDRQELKGKFDGKKPLFQY
jgi:hypothetical protein